MFKDTRVHYFIFFIFGLFFLLTPYTSHAVATLSPGDIFVVTTNGTGTYPSTNGFDFVSRVNIDAGTVIYFTDKGWNGSLAIPFWRAGTAEGVVRYTSPTAITAGTVVHFDDSLITALPGTWDMFSIDGTTGNFGVASGSNVMDFATSGDNILVFQGSGVSPSFLYGVGWAAGTTWISTGTPSSNNSYIPSPLSAVSNTIASLGTGANKQYACSVLGMFASTFMSNLVIPANWNSGAVVYPASSCLFDAIRPTVTINQAPLQNDPTNTNPINFQVVFSEAIIPATFSITDITISGTGTATAGTPTTTDNITWNIPVTATLSGTVILSIAASTVTDTNGNPNVVSTSTDNSVTYDNVAPSIAQSVAVVSLTNDNTPNYTFTADEPGSITYGGSCSSATTTAVSGINLVTFSTLTDGTYTNCTITVTDMAGNSSNILSVNNFTIDTTPPVVSISDPLPGSTISNSSTTISGVCSVLDGVVTILGTGITPVSQTAPCVLGLFSASVVLSPGLVTVNASQVDTALNSGNAVPVSLTYTVLVPVVTSPSAPMLIITPVNPVNLILNSKTFVSPVDGTQKACPGFTQYLTYGTTNAEIKLWQAFLNTYENARLPLTGFYGPKTNQAIKNFQLKYKKEILTPWGLTQPTGRVYQSTRFQANKIINCSENQLTLDNGVLLK